MWSFPGVVLRMRRALLLLLFLVPRAFCQNTTTRLEDLLSAARQAQAAENYTAAADDYRRAVALRPDMPELWANLGLMQHQSGAYSDAIRSFRSAYALKPALYVPNLFLGIDLFEINNPGEALPFLLRAAGMNNKDPEPLLFAGRSYSSLGKRALAAAELEHALQLDPQQPQAWFYLGLNDLDRVEDEARALTTANQDSPWAKSLYAESLLKQARYHEAVDVYKDVLAAPSHPPCLRAQLGMAWLFLQDQPDAAQQLQLAGRESPACPLALLGQARLDIDSGADKMAIDQLHRLWSRDRGFVRISASALTQENAPAALNRLAALAQQEWHAGTIPGDLEQFLQAVLSGSTLEPEDLSAPESADPQHSSTSQAAADYASGRYRRCEENAAAAAHSRDLHQLRLLLRCASLTGDDRVASRTADVLLSLTPQSPETLYWSIKAKEQLAVQALRRYEQLEPNSEKTHLLLGDMYRQRRQDEDAQAQYQQALAIRPDDPAALLGLAYAYFGDGNLTQALATAKQALAQSPSDPEVNLVIGEILVARHDFAGAEPFLRRSLGARPQMLPHIHALLGRVDVETGRNAEAIQELRQGLSSDTDGTVYYQLARACRRVGDNTDAEAAMEKVKALEQRRRQASVIAVEDSHPADPDSLP